VPDFIDADGIEYTDIEVVVETPSEDGICDARATVSARQPCKTSKEKGTERNRLNHRSTLFQNWPTDPCQALPATENQRTHIKIDIPGRHTLWRTWDVSYNWSSGLPEIIVVCCNVQGKLC
jgi:hypothetical protein